MSTIHICLILNRTSLEKISSQWMYSKRRQDIDDAILRSARAQKIRLQQNETALVRIQKPPSGNNGKLASELRSYSRGAFISVYVCARYILTTAAKYPGTIQLPQFISGKYYIFIINNRFFTQYICSIRGVKCDLIDVVTREQNRQ